MLKKPPISIEIPYRMLLSDVKGYKKHPLKEVMKL